MERQVAGTFAESDVPSLLMLQAAADAAWNAANSVRSFGSVSAPQLPHSDRDAGLTVGVRIVDRAESQQLNRDWRSRDKPTNVLSFPAPEGAFVPPGMPAEAGDLVICLPVVIDEARDAGISPDAHWSHMIIHGCLHLMGYDHIENFEAELMEYTEAEALACLGFANPYTDH